VYSAGSNGRRTASGRHDAVSSAASSREELRAHENGPSNAGLPALRRHATDALVQTGRAEHAAERRNTGHD